VELRDGLSSVYRMQQNSTTYHDRITVRNRLQHVDEERLVMRMKVRELV
jgi:hypothetical protein